MLGSLTPGLEGYRAEVGRSEHRTYTRSYGSPTPVPPDLSSVYTSLVRPRWRRTVRLRRYSKHSIAQGPISPWHCKMECSSSRCCAVLRAVCPTFSLFLPVHPGTALPIPNRRRSGCVWPASTHLGAPAQAMPGPSRGLGQASGSENQRTLVLKGEGEPGPGPG